MSENNLDDPAVDKALEELKRAESNLADAREAEKRAETEIEEASRELEGAVRHEEAEYEYAVDGVVYKTKAKALTGAQVKSLIPNVNPAYQLVEESRGTEPDRVIADAETIRIDVKPMVAFYLVPPATFGK